MMLHDTTWFYPAVYLWMAIGCITMIFVFRIRAPYGRHVRPGWGPVIPARLGWIMMESPALFGVLGFYFISDYRDDPARMVFIALWVTHYGYRTLIYPFRARISARPMPLAIAAMAIGFNGVNATLLGVGLFILPLDFGPAWFATPQFWLGLGLFVSGYTINHRADAILFALRAPGETGYKIPRGSLYRWVSCPNYLGEIVEWVGFAVLTWSLPGACFALWTIANLAPRARDHHRWYVDKFDDYPPERKALIPYVF
ncbi:MAG: DUF1295 domain-containing protein [Myxococcota bacterium]|nr:DUF1295 domain-containing protein [Myxococcota bacterium]